MLIAHSHLFRIISAVLMAIAANIGVAVAQVPVPLTTQPDRSIHVTVDGVRISDRDIAVLVHGLYDAGSKQVDTVKKQPAEMPAQSPYIYYAGRNAATGRGTVWVSTAGRNPVNEYTAAYALAAIDLGYVGEPWKSLYRAAVKDDASRLAFGEQISKALVDASYQQEAITAADVTWIRQHIAVGMPRRDVYAALRAYGLVAYNYAYAPGTPTSQGKITGCDTSDTSDQLAAAWPYAGEPVPKRTGGCATAFGPGTPEAFPSAYITLEGGFDIACGSSIDVTMNFGAGDQLEKLDIAKPQVSCV